MGDSIDLGEVQETLLIPLYGRALDAKAKVSVLDDQTAVRLVDSIDYDFAKFTGPSLSGSVLRASIFDGYVRDFLREHPDGTVVDLGCGLSTRFERLDNGRVRWFDVDLPDTMALRRRYVSDSDRCTTIAASIFDDIWHDAVTERGGPIFLLSEAVLLYFDEARVHEVLRRFVDRFPGGRLAIDTGGHLMMNSQDRNPVFKALPARMQWICDDPRALESLGLTLLDSRNFAQPQREIAATWPRKYRVMMRLMSFTPMVTTYRMNLFTL